MLATRTLTSLRAKLNSFVRMASSESKKLRIGYIPEHFSTPIHFAFSKFGLSDHATLQSFPSGTGTMIEAFEKDEIDVGIGLTEAWVAGLCKKGSATASGKPQPYHVVGAYTESPLRWALSTGGKRQDVNEVGDVKGKKVGISRYGSGSYVMSFVLADEQGWLKGPGEAPFDFVVCGPFKPLRDAVNSGDADFFMWEHFTSKKFFDDGTLKRIGEILTPWNAWYIASRGAKEDARVRETLLPALEKGVEYFEGHPAESVQFICDNMEYSKEDAEEWMKGVKFAKKPGTFDEATMKKTHSLLVKAGVLDDQSPSWEVTKAQK